MSLRAAVSVGFFVCMRDHTHASFRASHSHSIHQHFTHSTHAHTSSHTLHTHISHTRTHTSSLPFTTHSHSKHTLHKHTHSLTLTLLSHTPPTHHVELKRLRLEDRHSSKSSEPMSYSQTVMNEKQSKTHTSHSSGDAETGHSSAPHEREREKPHNNHNKYVVITT